MALYWPTPGFKGRMFKRCVLTRWDFSFCVCSSSLRGAHTERRAHTQTQHIVRVLLNLPWLAKCLSRSLSFMFRSWALMELKLWLSRSLSPSCRWSLPFWLPWYSSYWLGGRQGDSWRNTAWCNPSVKSPLKIQQKWSSKRGWSVRVLSRAVNSSIDLSALKSDFKCNNWILSIMYISEQNTHPQCHRRQHSIHYITVLWCTPRWRFHTSRIFVWYSSLKVCLSFWIFPQVAQGPIFASFLSQHDCCKRTEEQKLHFARKELGRKWGFKRGKMNQVLRLARLFKSQKLIGCSTTTRKCQLLVDSLSSPGTHARKGMKMTIFLFYLHFLV